MMAPQEFTKVPTSEKVSRTDKCESLGGRTTWRERLKLNLPIRTRTPCYTTITAPQKEKSSLILQDGFDHRLCNDEAVWIHHAILSTDLSCTYRSSEQWARNWDTQNRSRSETASHQRCRSWSVPWSGSASRRPERWTWWRWSLRLSLYLETHEHAIITGETAASAGNAKAIVEQQK